MKLAARKTQVTELRLSLSLWVVVCVMFGRESRAWFLSSINAAVDVNRSRVSIEGVNDQELPDQLNDFF